MRLRGRPTSWRAPYRHRQRGLGRGRGRNPVLNVDARTAGLVCCAVRTTRAEFLMGRLAWLVRDDLRYLDVVNVDAYSIAIH